MTAFNSFITCTSNGCPTDHLPVRGASKHDSGNRGTRLFVANESASDRAERLHNRNRKAASRYLTIHEILEGPHGRD